MKGLVNVSMASRLHPGLLILDALHLSSALSSRSSMTAISWRTSHMFVPSFGASRRFHFSCCGKLLSGLAHSPPVASFRLSAAVPSSAARSSSLHGFAPCRGAADRDGNGVELEGDFERNGNDFVRDNVGSIHVITGPMFAGKTTALLKRVQKEADAGRRVSLVKSDKDNRYAVAAVVSHDGVQMPCVAVPSLAAFREHVGEEEYKQMDVIGIDEAQFFDDLVEFCQNAADLDNKTVIVAGLDGDFLRRRFGAALDLIPLADSVTKLHARCELCNQPAPFTFRKTVDTETEIIGGADVYMPVCRHHFVSGQCAVETARSVLQVKPLEPSNSRAN